MNTKEFIKSIDLIAKEKNIDVHIVEEAIKNAIASGYKKKYPCTNEIKVVINYKKCKIELFKQYNVVTEEITDDKDILLNCVPIKHRKEAKQTGLYYKEISLKDLGRLAVQATKQILLQNIEHERRLSIYEEFKNREGSIISGKITSIDNITGNIVLNLGKIETILYKNEQIKGEFHKVGKLIDVYLVSVVKDSKGILIYVSRKNVNFVRKIFEKQIPEISKGIVQIKDIAREAGIRTKISVYSEEENFDSIGACIGVNKSRISNILDDLGNEKIQLIKWSSNPSEYIKNAIEPAKAIAVILDEMNEDKEALVIVPDDEYSLAIGKKGQNALLTVKLTGWKINIKSSSEAHDLGIEV